MSRIAATMSPGRANRRFLMLALALGVLGAVLVYVATSRGSSGGGGGGIADTAVVVARTDIPARTKITNSMVEIKLVPQADVSNQAYVEVEPVVGQTTRFPIAANEQVLSSKVVALGTTSNAASRSLAFVVPPGKRAFAIETSEVQSAGGLVLPGDYVDVVVIYDVDFPSKPGDPESMTKADAYLVQTLLQNVEVLSVKQSIVDVVPEATPSAGGQRARNSEAKPEPEAKTVTLSVTPEEVQKLYLAEGNGRIRLSVRHFGESDQQPIDYMTELDLLPRNLANPFLR